MIEILHAFSTGELQRVFRTWIERVEKALTVEGGCES
jgi:hypothetical protein